MPIATFQTRLVKHIEENLGNKILETKIPPQGMTSQVFFVAIDNGEEYAIKYGEDAMKDVPAFELISEKNVSISVPKLIKAFVFEETPVVILEKVEYPLLETVPVNEMAKYIPSMVKNLKKLHKIKSDKPGLLTEPDSTKTWKEMMLSIFNGGDFNWQEVASREGVDGKLILDSVEKMVNKINTTDLPENNFSFLHTDFNQRNLFVDPNSDEITGIIDWEEAMFGDPLYDLARVRMYIWHFDLGEKVVEDYYKLLGYTEEQKKVEELYWLSRVIQYLGWYSEELKEFNTGRIKLHQEFLRNYAWERDSFLT